MPVYMRPKEFGLHIIEINPCKHCGGEASVVYDYGARFLYSNRRVGCGWRIGCKDSTCEGFRYRSKLYMSDTKAIEDWNANNKIMANDYDWEHTRKGGKRQ